MALVLAEVPPACLPMRQALPLHIVAAKRRGTWVPTNRTRTSSICCPRALDTGIQARLVPALLDRGNRKLGDHWRLAGQRRLSGVDGCCGAARSCLVVPLPSCLPYPVPRVCRGRKCRAAAAAAAMGFQVAACHKFVASTPARLHAASRMFAYPCCACCIMLALPRERGALLRARQ